MKHIYTILMTTLSLSAIAQAPFWEETNYKGAFPVTDNTSATDWTSGWTNFDPENTTYPATNVTVSADITSNTTWSNGSVVLLQNKVFVKNGATLTIEAGVIVRGDHATEGALIVTKGAKLIAKGTSNNPIIFTSNEDPGDRAEGDWGGIILLGNAVINQGSANIEGLTTSTDTEYGGSDDEDSSGSLSYLRIEFPGIAFQPNKEINGLTLGGVGSKTNIDHIQVSFSGDDSYEWFGGKVDAKYLIAFRGLDDDFDTDFGFRGRVQFGLAIRDKDLFDAAGSSNCFESDNDANGSNLQPLTAAVFSNMTLIGAKRDGSETLPVGEKFEKAFCIRRNSSLSCLNSLIIGWDKGLSVEGSATEDNFSGDSAFFAYNNLLDLSNGTNVVTASNSFYSTFFGTDMNDSTQTKTNVNWVNPFPANLYDVADFRLNSNSTVATGANFDHAVFAGDVIAISVREININNHLMTVYPNPAKNNVTIKLDQPQNAISSIVIYNTSGHIVYNCYLNSKSISVNTESFVNGLYMVVINTDQNTHQTIHLIVEN